MKVNVRTVCQKSLTVHHLPVKTSLTQQTLLCVGEGGFIYPWYEESLCHLLPFHLFLGCCLKGVLLVEILP